MDNKKLLWGGLAAVGVAAAIWFLSQEDSKQINYNKRNHPTDVMMAFAKEMDLDFRCFYVRCYNLILKMKSNGEFDNRMLGDLEKQLNIELDEKAKGNIKAFNTDIFKVALKNADTDRETAKNLMVKFNKALASRNDEDMIAVYKEFSPESYKSLYKDFANRRISIEAYEQFLIANKNNEELQQVC